MSADFSSKGLLEITSERDVPHRRKIFRPRGSIFSGDAERHVLQVAAHVSQCPKLAVRLALEWFTLLQAAETRTLSPMARFVFSHRGSPLARESAFRLPSVAVPDPLTVGNARNLPTDTTPAMLWNGGHNCPTLIQCSIQCNGITTACTGVAVVRFSRNHDFRRHPVMPTVIRLKSPR
ncbi:hypothetical protein Poly51_59350 [Rubripirellula tenax]|uniref:Uncharacterized protein n=1 Tax=Rubripirellula tenax TaxID=2528015 RepID=A0A5C6EAZ5_9BACT|nr:hypothetical protein Poly51_59350 [Rubripirellula tenax]